MRGYILSGGNGGDTSDDCTAVLANVLEGTSAITSDSNDEAAEGTLPLISVMETNGGTLPLASVMEDKGGTLPVSKVLDTHGGTIPTKDSSDLTVNEATVIVPEGYYAEQTSKSISNGVATTPATTIQQSAPSISIDSSGKITASVEAKSQNITPTVLPGYIADGTAGTISLSANSNTKQMTTKAAATTTLNASTTSVTIAAGTYLTGQQKIQVSLYNYA